MGLRPLGPAWRRRIERATGLKVHAASGDGGYVHYFTTVDHVHGTIHAKTLALSLFPGECWHLSSCHGLPPVPSVLPAPAVEHRHNLIHAEDGIGCRGCELWVPKPSGASSYDGARMGDW